MRAQPSGETGDFVEVRLESGDLRLRIFSSLVSCMTLRSRFLQVGPPYAHLQNEGVPWTW